MQNDLLIVEDLMLLLLDDKTGSPAGAGTLYYTLGGAVLVELALQGRVEAEEGRFSLNGPKINVVGDGPLSDPLLQSAYDKVAEKTQRVQPLLIAIGADLWKVVVERLLERGLIRRETRKVLGLFKTTRLPAEETGYEAALRQRVCDVLEDGAPADAHLAAVIGLVSASGTLPTLDPAPKWSGKVHDRAKEFEQGNWGSEAVNAAVMRTAAAIAASSAAIAVSVAGSTS
ncbi:GOLPH3/VPS74 family protein [Actinoalloteichus hymeniacidonis]|uniref:Phosphoprotein n=1 Tax=Actinoalloteichus hymeniacidonis TaxID=340345 RepID=A0AAC9HUN2_9PSEU|nr:GPP34 family phosphoprotein [Actinoalloteichus hymeniacidonis]AOS66042.1 putative phosphoprotein [Actinoalloteichus hymeniacidonis]MBB5905855.1 hypothetical protein [Actinoalloteichus hymeniacidonis]